MEKVVSPEFWRGRRVLITGHTGFKGGWLALWLQSLGAEVFGYALPPAAGHNLFDIAQVGADMQNIYGDIRNLALLSTTLRETRPEIIFHLAAQALVAAGYAAPVDTYQTNVIGTINLLEAARQCETLRAVVVVTSDKCYDNREWSWAYRENEALGGADPYSSSKACAEIVTAAYRRSYFSQPAAARIATARAGNVIGGGDWSDNRLVPDLLQAFAAGRPAGIRNPSAVRPWQHTLEALGGYLLLAEHLCQKDAAIDALNFGPPDTDCVAVDVVATLLARCWSPEAQWEPCGNEIPHEAGILKLDASLARNKLGWRPRWTLQQALQATADWHRAWCQHADMRAMTRQQIEDYTRA